MLFIPFLLLSLYGQSQFNFTSGWRVNVSSSISLINGGIGRTTPGLGYSNSLKFVYQPFGLIQIHAGYEHVHKASVHQHPEEIGWAQYDCIRFRFHDHDAVFGGVFRFSFLKGIRPYGSIDISIPLGVQERSVGVLDQQQTPIHLGQNRSGKIKYTIGGEFDLNEVLFLRLGGYWMEESRHEFRYNTKNYVALGLELNLIFLLTRQ